MATYVEIGGYQADLDYARITHINRPNIKFIRSFHIRSMDGGAKWLTIVNQKTLIGIYPNREAALGALIGCYLYVGGFVGSVNVSGPVIGPNNTITAGIGVSIDDLLGTGGGIIDGAENDLSIPVIVEGAGTGAVHVRIDEYDPSIYPKAGNQYYGFQVSALEDATTWPSITATTYLVTAPISAAAQIENQFTGLDMTLLENKAIRPVMVNEDLGTYTIVKYGLPYVIDFETDTLVLGVEISGADKIEAPTAVGGVAYANTTVTGAAPGKSVSLAYEWYREIPTLSNFTSTALSIDSPVAPTFNGTPSASATDPTVGDEVNVLNYGASGNPAPDILFEWRVDGTVDNSSTTDTFDTSSLSGGEVLTCVVTASNGVSPDDTATISFGTVAAAGPSVKYSLSGTLTAAINPLNTARRNLSGVSESGTDSATLDPYSSGDLLINNNFKIVIYLDVVGMSAEDFKTAMGSSPGDTATVTLEANGVNLPLNTVTVSSDVIASLGSINISCYATDNDEASWFLNNCTIGNSFTFTLDY